MLEGGVGRSVRGQEYIEKLGAGKLVAKLLRMQVMNKSETDDQAQTSEAY